MHGEKYGEALRTIRLSNYTVMRRKDIKEQLLTRIKCNPKSALQIDESTDIAGLAQPLYFQILFLRRHPGTFRFLSSAFKEMQSE
jgi:hypothetical protein